MKTQKHYLWIDQYGYKLWARTAKELREKCGGGRISKMYRDKADGSSVHCGYVIGQHWFSKYEPVERPA
jgi:hypothetical protein